MRIAHGMGPCSGNKCKIVGALPVHKAASGTAKPALAPYMASAPRVFRSLQ